MINKKLKNSTTRLLDVIVSRESIYGMIRLFSIFGDSVRLK